MRHFIALILIALCPLLAHSQTSRLEKAERISKAMGLDEILAQAQSSGTHAVNEQITTMLDQLRKQGIPKELLEKLSPAIQRLVEVSVNSWNPKVAARIYAEGLVDHLTEEELVEAEKYYSSPAGAKTHRAVAESLQKMQAYIQDQSTKAIEPEMARFFEELKKITLQAQRK